MKARSAVMVLLFGLFVAGEGWASGEPASAGAASRAGKDTTPPPTPELSPLNPEADELPEGRAARPPVDFDRLLADIAALRSRIAALTRGLFASTLQVSLEAGEAESRITQLAITLDGGVVYQAANGFAGAEAKILYEHAVAPGYHVLGIEIERMDSRGREYRTWQSSRFSVFVPEKRRLSALFSIEDDSDMAESFPNDQEGSYLQVVNLRAEVEQ